MSGDTVTFAGTGASGQINGPVTSATFSSPNGIAVSPSGDTLYISDYGTRSLRVITDVSSAVINMGTSVPTGFKLRQNYPNPFNPSTNIEFEIPVKGAVLVKVYDTLGNEVSTVVNESLPAGTYRTNFNAGKLSSGTYFVRLILGSFTETKKMTLIK